ncbi:MAG: S8 family serine peptidase [Haloechinothrix sp.]
MSSHRARRALVGVTIAATAAACVGLSLPTAIAAPGGPATGGNPANDSTTAIASADTDSAIVVFEGDPLATNDRSVPEHGAKLNFRADAVKSERAKLAANRSEFRSWLSGKAQRAKVTQQFDIALNAVAVDLNGTNIETLRSAPGVAAVRPTKSYRLLDEADPDLNLIRAVEAWQSARVGGPANAGKGIKVGVIDSGIDNDHPCFDDAGYPATEQLGDTRFTNNKVIVAKVFNSDASLTPEAIGSHGTHVAGTVACNLDTPAGVRGAEVPYQVSGVAPFAKVGNYNVFPGEVADVTDADLLEAMEEAYTDGMDVINMSLGGPIGPGPDLLARAVDNLDKANLVSAIAAGNSGPGHSTVQSPGVAERGLTAGASTVGHFVGAPITVGDIRYSSATGDFAVVEGPLIAPLGVVTGPTNGLGDACATLPADSLDGKIAVVSRGACSFSTKIRNAEDSGAVATVVVNNVAGDPISMGIDPSVQPAPTIPAYLVGLGDADGLVAADGQPATIGAELSYFRTDNDNIMAGFSSQGPSPDTARRAKPDVVAPGVNVLSSIPVSHCGADVSDCWTFMQGTSMASPHLAGMAAVLRAAHPDWTAEQVRSAVVNTASDGVPTRYTDPSTEESDVNVAGAGLADLLGAVDAKVAVGPVSTSFGTLVGARKSSAVIQLSSLTGKRQTVSLDIDTVVGSGVRFKAPKNVVVPASGTVRVRVTATQLRAGGSGDQSAILRLSSRGTEIAHSVLYAHIP